MDEGDGSWSAKRPVMPTAVTAWGSGMEVRMEYCSYIGVYRSLLQDWRATRTGPIDQIIRGSRTMRLPLTSWPSS